MIVDFLHMHTFTVMIYYFVANHLMILMLFFVEKLTEDALE